MFFIMIQLVVGIIIKFKQNENEINIAMAGTQTNGRNREKCLKKPQ